MSGAPEPIVSSIDPARLSYDYLVDGELSQDDPAHKQFKTLQAAYAAALGGTDEKRTVIGIRPGVYQLPGGAPRTPSLRVEKNYITFLGLTNNRRAVVLADNRGLMQGAEDDGYIIDVNATGFTAKNLTILNFCNTDYDYPGDPKKNLTKRSAVITQAVAIQAAGDKHVYENVALLSRLDTMFLRTTRSYFKNVYIEGTDDWIGGGQISVWDDCTLVFPTGRGVMTASNLVFFNCRFEATRGMALYKAEFRSAERPDVLIDCVLPENSSAAPVAWVRGKTPPRPSVYTFTYHNKDTTGKPAVIYDSTVGSPTFEYAREMTDRERAAYNPWNLLRAAPHAAPDDWDPAGVREKYESAGQGSVPFRLSLTGGSAIVRTGGAGIVLGASVIPQRADQTITWSTPSNLVALSASNGASVTVTGRNETNAAQWVAIDAKAATGVVATAHFWVKPKLMAPPAVVSLPTVRLPVNGMLSVEYGLDLGGREDQSEISWWICGDAQGKGPRLVAVSRDDQPLRTLTLTSGYVGKFVKVGLRPKHTLSEAGPEVTAVSQQAIAAADVPAMSVAPVFRNFVVEVNETFVSGLWTVLGAWSIVPMDDKASNYGARPTKPGALLYQQDAPSGDMQVDVTMTTEKTEGTGFSIPGSPADTGERNLHADIYIKYDARTRNGYALRYWRTTQSAAACMYQFYKIENGAGSPIDDQKVLSGVLKPVTHFTIKATAKNLSVTGSNSTDDSTLTLESPYETNNYGGAGVSWPRGSPNTFSQLEISYLKPGPVK